jgi:polyhydroxyalkanoate synthesis regulator phasin
MAGNLGNVRAIMDISTDAATRPRAFSVWLFPFGSDSEDESLVLFFRDKEGAEELFVYHRGVRLRMASPIDDQLRKFIDGTSAPEPLKDQVRFASMLSSTNGRQALQAYLETSSVDPLPDAQLDAVLGWLESAAEVKDALMTAIYGRVGPVLDTEQQLIRELARGVSDFMDTVRHEAKESLAAYEKNQEKRLKGLHSDVDKMRMITEGVRKRADRTDADNQALRKRLRELEARHTAGGVVSASAEVPAEGDAVRRALDAFF